MDGVGAKRQNGGHPQERAEGIPVSHECGVGPGGGLAMQRMVPLDPNLPPSMSTPFSLACAFRRLKRRPRRQQQHRPKPPAPSGCPPTAGQAWSQQAALHAPSKPHTLPAAAAPGPAAPQPRKRRRWRSPTPAPPAQPRCCGTTPRQIPRRLPGRAPCRLPGPTWSYGSRRPSPRCRCRRPRKRRQAAKACPVLRALPRRGPCRRGCQSGGGTAGRALGWVQPRGVGAEAVHVSGASAAAVPRRTTTGAWTWMWMWRRRTTAAPRPCWDAQHPLVGRSVHPALVAGASLHVCKPGRLCRQAAPSSLITAGPPSPLSHPQQHHHRTPQDSRPHPAAPPTKTRGGEWVQ